MSAQRSILVVDDDPQLLRLMARLLEKAGHPVHTAATAEAALASLEPSLDGAAPAFALAILDVNLAAGEGAATLLPELRARVPGLDVLLISGDALPASLEQALAEQGGRFLRKPFAPPALLALVEAGTAEARTQAAAAAEAGTVEVSAGGEVGRRTTGAVGA